MSFELRKDTDPMSKFVSEVRAVMEEIFTEAGMETILYYLKVNYDTDLRDAWEDPLKFQRALEEFLGDFGGKLLLKRIVRRVSPFGTHTRPGSQENPGLEVVVRSNALSEIVEHNSGSIST